MEKLKKSLSKITWPLLIVLSFPAVWALLVPGLYGASDEMHIAWLYEMDRAIKSGQIPPRFAPDLSYGFGYPLFNFLFPLPFYIGEIFHLLGLGLVDSFKAVLFISLPISMLTMYLFLKDFTNKWLSVAGAVVYGFTPYRSTDIYVRGAIGESLAFIFLPLIILSILKLTNLSLNLRWIGIGGVSSAALILTHNITALMFFPFILFLAFLNIIFIQGNRVLRLIQLCLMFMIGLSVSLYFWLPALLDSQLMVYDAVFNFADHFPALNQLLIPNWGYGGSVAGPGDGMSFFVGTVNLILGAIGSILAVYFWKRFKLPEKIIIVWAIVSFVIVFAMMNHRALFIWQSLPFLPYFQFPWRFLIMTTFLTPVFFLSFNCVKGRTVIAGLVIGLTILINTPHFRPQDFLGLVDQYFLNRYIPVPQASDEYRQINEEYLRLPKNTLQRPDRNYPAVMSNLKGIKSVESKDGLNVQITTDSPDDLVVEYSKYLFPGWEGRIDGSLINLQAGQPFGQITAYVPAGRHRLTINFKETAFKKILDIVSLASILSALALILGFRPSLYESSLRFKTEFQVHI